MPPTPYTPPARAYPGAKDALVLLLLAMVVGIAVQGAIRLLARAGLDPSHPGVQAAGTMVAFAVVIAYGVRRTQASWREVLPLRPVPLSLLAPMALTILGLGVLLSEADNVLRSVLPPPAWLERMFVELTQGRRSLWGSIALLVVAAPLTEETLFRGVFLYGFLRRYSARRAILVSALLFAVFHLNPWQFLGALTAGAVFAWWVVRTGSLVPALACHALNNSVPVIVSQLPVRITGYSGVPTGAVEFHPWWFDALGVTIAAAGLWLVVRGFRSTGPPSTSPTPSDTPA